MIEPWPAQELEKNGRAKVYGLYFDFRSDVLRPESKKVLEEIAQAMRQHPDWKLSVEVILNSDFF